jgi:hypothetical protein
VRKGLFSYIGLGVLCVFALYQKHIILTEVASHASSSREYIQLSKSPIHDPYTLLYYHLFVTSTLYIFTMPPAAYQSNDQLSASPQHYDMDSNFTVSTYSRTMFQHTQKQMDAATRSAKRRRASEQNGVNAHGTLDTQGSVSSTDSSYPSLKD